MENLWTFSFQKLQENSVANLGRIVVNRPKALNALTDDMRVRYESSYYNRNLERQSKQ